MMRTIPPTLRAQANGIELAYDSFGDPADPALLLIMGLGTQMIAWDEAFCEQLAERGLRVIRFDNRDIGLSQWFDELGVPSIGWAALRYTLRLPVRAPYTLADMAADTVGVLDALGIAQAHVCGASMGGMIAQRVALAAPGRTLSLISIMSTSGAKGLPNPKAKVIRALMARPKGQDREAILKHYVHLLRVIGSPTFPMEESLVRERISAGLDRSYAPFGTMRQMVAIAADTGRARALAAITAPTLVLHGKADPLVPYACGEDTARRIAGSRMVGIDGMGHDLPPEVITRLLPPMLGHLQST